MTRAAAIALALLFVAGIGAARAVEPGEMLSDPVLEQRARDIGRHLRCLVCQNQSIDESKADLARDLRILVRERLKAGDTDQQAMDFITARYGDFVLLRPPVNEQTLPLWLGPFTLIFLGLIAIAFYFWRRPRAGPPPLTAAERKRLDELLRDKTP